MSRPKIGCETADSITITKPWVVKRIFEEAAKSQTKPSTWAAEALEDWVLRKRAGQFAGDPARHDDQEPDNTGIYCV